MLNQLIQRVRGLNAPAQNTLRPYSAASTLPAVEMAIATSVPSPIRRTVKLIMVTAENNNKYYEMREKENDTFEVRYGRVGGFQSKATHPMSQWNQKIREKKAKGYTDQTHLYVENGPATDASTIKNAEVRSLMSRLLELAKQSVFQNYVVTAQQVTRNQVDTAQQLLDELAALLTPGMNTTAYNTKLLDLFTVIPRRMTHVGKYLASENPQPDADMQLLHDRLAEEQDTLDVMRSQVELTPISVEASMPPPTLLDSLGLTIEPVTDAHVIKLIRRMMGTDAHKFDAAFSVCHRSTEAAFDTYLRQQTNRKTVALWHGSRSENWLSILKTGLVLRPANAVITGKMFGYGIYFADQFSKSLNYTSLMGSVWTNEQQQEGYLAIYEVHVGNQLEVTTHQPWHMHLDADRLKAQGPQYDSVFGKHGASLQKNEFIVYNPAQCTVRYIVRIKS